MKQGRETTQEERIAIVKNCLENGARSSKKLGELERMDAFHK